MSQRLIQTAFLVSIGTIPCLAGAQELPAPALPQPVIVGETPKNPVPTPAPIEQLDSPETQPAERNAPTGNATPVRRVSLGVVAEEQPDRDGLVVLSVRDGSPAQRAGVRVGDVLTGLDGRATNTIEDVAQSLAGIAVGQTITVEVARRSQLFELRATMENAAPPSVNVVPPTQSNDSIPQASAAGHGILGVVVEDARSTLGNLPILRGARVVSVAPGTPAEAMGFRVGDIVVSLDGRVMYGSRELIAYMQSTRPGQTVDVGYYRQGTLARTAIALGGPEGFVAGGNLPPSNPPGVIVGRPPNVGDILDGVGRTIDGILGGRRSPRPLETPPQVESYPPTRTPGVPQFSPDATPMPADNPVARDSPEVLQLRQQVEQLLERVRTLESQLNRQQPAPKTPESL